MSKHWPNVVDMVYSQRVTIAVTLLPSAMGNVTLGSWRPLLHTSAHEHHHTNQSISNVSKGFYGPHNIQVCTWPLLVATSVKIITPNK